MHWASLFSLSFVSLSLASPLPSTEEAQGPDAISVIQQISPETKSPCPADNKDCSDAKTIADHTSVSMQKYGIYNRNQIAAVLSLMAFESGDYKYRHNVVPGRPGQGTANMQMAEYNLLYAKSLEGVKDDPLIRDRTSTSGMSDDQLNQMLALVTTDEHNFGSGAWFLTTQCDDSVMETMVKDADEGFKAYAACVGWGDDAGRQEYFDRAKKAFGITP